MLYFKNLNYPVKKENIQSIIKEMIPHKDEENRQEEKTTHQHDMPVNKGAEVAGNKNIDNN